MSHPAYLRDKARELRVTKRLTIDEIAERLALPRTTVFHWVRDLRIPRTSRQTVPQGLGNVAMQAKWRAIREAAYLEGRESFADHAQDPTFCDFVCLYIAEGYKRNRNRVSIGNSDPAVMIAAVHWLRRLSDHPITFAIQYHADQDLDELRAFWGRTLATDGDAIKFQRKSNSNQLRKRTWRSEHGVVTATVNDTLLRARLQGWIDVMKEGWLTLA